MNDMVDNLLRKYKQAPVTFLLIAVCVIVYIISFFLFGEEMNALQALTLGAYNPIYVYVNHEYWRLLTSHFIHFGILHVVVNCYSLYGIGSFIESVLKTKKYVIVIIVSAIFTNGLPYLLFLINGFGSHLVSGGISGIIFGLIGAIAALAFTYKNIFLDIFKNLAPNVILMLFISLLVPSISLSGHVCGLIGGFVGTYFILRLKRNTSSHHLVN